MTKKFVSGKSYDRKAKFQKINEGEAKFQKVNKKGWGYFKTPVTKKLRLLKGQPLQGSKDAESLKTVSTKNGQW